MFYILAIATHLLNQCLLPNHPGLVEKPPSPWIVEEAYEVQERHPSQKGCQILLYDKQINLETNEIYCHEVKRILEGGVEKCAQLGIDFDPSFESLALHKLAIYREGERIDTPSSKDVRLLQMEENLTNNIYSGALNLHFLLHDLCKDDVIELAYTITGKNPILGEHFFDAMELSFPFQVDKICYRCLRNKEKPLHIKVHYSNLIPEEILFDDSLIESRLTVAPSYLLNEWDAPSWHISTPWLQVSTFETWEEVSYWGKALFQSNESDIIPEIKDLVASWSESTKDKEALVLKALSFVQNDIRYFGTEQGIYSFKPYSPDEILTKKYGDCKDKTQLLKCFLDALGISSTPCFVHTYFKQAVQDFHPSPAAFNHALLKINLGDEEFLVDPTSQYEGGGLKERSQYYFQCYLPLGEEKLATAVPHENDSSLEITRHFNLDSANGQLTITRLAKGECANYWRSLIAYHGKEGISDCFRDDIAATYGQAEVVEPIEIEDDPESNQVMLVSKFYIESLLAPLEEEENIGYFDHWPVTICSSLPDKVDTVRATPLEIPNPVKIKETVHITSNYPFNEYSFSEVVDHPAFTFKLEEGLKENEGIYQYSYETKSDHILPSDLLALRSKINKIEDLSYRRCITPIGQIGSPPHSSLLDNLGLITLPVIILVIVFMFRPSKPKDIKPHIKKQWKKAYLIYLIIICSILVIINILYAFSAKVLLEPIVVIAILLSIQAGWSYLLFAKCYKKDGTILLGFLCLSLSVCIWNLISIYLLVRSLQLFRHNRASKRAARTRLSLPKANSEMV